MTTKTILLSLALLAGCASARQAQPVTPQPDPSPAQLEEQQARRQAVFGALLSGLSEASSRRAQEAGREADRRAMTPTHAEPARMICRPAGPYSDEVICREQP